MSRVLLLWLDGYDPSVGDALIAAGRLPALGRLRAESARVSLDHGAARWTGLAGEHLSTGLSPDDARRQAAVHFDRARYAVWQQGTSLEPFAAALAKRTVVFDPPYFDLGRAPRVRGIVVWGAHDPGTPPAARPESLAREVEARFGAYPATEWIYGFAWPSAARAEAMGRALARASDVRAAAAHWLLAERCPDWDLAIVTSSELHSAAEALWHGYDPAHPLHCLPSAEPAGRGFLAVYEAIDRLVGRLADAFPDAALLACSLHGMGPNRSDVPSMALLPELLYRDRFGHALLHARPDWEVAPDAAPLREDENWSWAMAEAMASGRSDETAHDDDEIPWPDDRCGIACQSVSWIPAARYRRFWRDMPAFALPSFYDGRVRINLAGRESAGIVTDYAAACDRVESLLRECRDMCTGRPVAAAISRVDNPGERGETGADMHVVWAAAHVGFVHPRLGRIGPLPHRRTGGHTGGNGMAYLRAPRVEPGDFGTRSAFDVVPTVAALLGERIRASGASFLPALAPRALAAD